MANDTSTQIVREAPEIEAYKTGLLGSAKAQVDAANAAAAQGNYINPDYKIAGMSGNQLSAIGLGQAGIGAYQPYLANATSELAGGQQTLGQAIGTLQGADTRGQFAAGQGLVGEAARSTMGQMGPIGQSDIQQYMNPYSDLVLNNQLDEMNRQAQIQNQGLQAQAVKAGAFGGMREGVQRAEQNRNLSQLQNQAIAQSMQQNYGQGLAAAQQQQQAQLGAANQLNTIGQGIGSLAGQQFNVGSALAQGLGSLANQQATMASTSANLGQGAQQLGQQDVNFLYNIGANQQKQTQAELDAARQNQLQKNLQPYQQIGYLSDIYKGAPTTQMSMSTQQAPSASPFQQIAGLGTGILGTAAAANSVSKLF